MPAMCRCNSYTDVTKVMKLMKTHRGQGQQPRPIKITMVNAENKMKFLRKLSYMKEADWKVQVPVPSLA